MELSPEYVRTLERRLNAYSHLLHEVELAEAYATRVPPERVLSDLSHRAHNVLCHLEDGCGH